MTSVASTGLAAWHAVVRRPSEAGLDGLLADDVVFHSPIVHTPQRGRALARLYLMAAFQVLAAEVGEGRGARSGEASGAPSGEGRDEPSGEGPARGGVARTPRFRYVREVVGERDAVLEFESEIDGITIDGVDMIRFDDSGRIVDFKVMVRPLKAVQAIHAAMGRMLEAMQRG